MYRRLCAFLLILFLAPIASARLTADQLLLVANKNLPDSLELARHYAKVRGVPGGQILELDLPVTETILPREYESRLAGPVRAYLQSPAGANVRCVTLFYGVPLHVRSMENDEHDRREITQLRALLKELDERAAPVAQAMEELVRSMGAQPRVIGGKGAQVAAQRAASAEQQIRQLVAQKPEMRETAEEAIRLISMQNALAGIEAMNKVFPPAGDAPPTTRPVQIDPADLKATLEKPRDADARATARRLTANAGGGVFVLYQIADLQLNWLRADESDASVDSELAMVRLPDFARYRWSANTLNYRAAPTERPVTIMTARIDAPTPQVARRLIDEAVDVEKTGLKGSVVFDSRGIPEKRNGKLDGYGWYDQAIRNAAEFVKKSTNLNVVTDDRPQVFLPRANKEAALYVGWYSLQNYVPGTSFNPGAVAYHVASLELTSMRKQNSKEWVPNLLRDGVCATLGAVSEPYLHSFPRPEEFFPLLLTGEPTLAEAYWLTCPMTSWKMILIGDPLYRPYATNPPLKRADLPADLSRGLSKIEGNGASDR